MSDQPASATDDLQCGDCGHAPDVPLSTQRWCGCACHEPKLAPSTQPVVGALLRSTIREVSGADAETIAAVDQACDEEARRRAQTVSSADPRPRGTLANLNAGGMREPDPQCLAPEARKLWVCSRCGVSVQGPDHSCLPESNFEPCVVAGCNAEGRHGAYCIDHVPGGDAERKLIEGRKSPLPNPVYESAAEEIAVLRAALDDMTGFKESAAAERNALRAALLRLVERVEYAHRVDHHVDVWIDCVEGRKALNK